MGGPASSEREDAIRALWSEGSYEAVGDLFTPVSEALVGELDLEGLDVLDAAAGTGNTALAAARAGARVAAFDLTPRLLEVARERAAAAGLEIDWREGDLLDIPFRDAAFDIVVSTFGAFVADDHRRCAEELVRVCRPGGRVVSTAWAGEGMFGVLTAAIVDRHPQVIDPDRPDPRDWASAEGIDRIFAGLPVEVALERRTVWFAFPSADDALAMLEAASGPVRRLRDAVEEEAGAWSGVREEVLRRWRLQQRAAAHGIELPAVYGLATAVRR